MEKLLCIALGLGLMASAVAQVPIPEFDQVAALPVEDFDQAAMLASDDPKLAANKKLVYDFWRTVYEGANLERAAEFMRPEYLQHNPNVPSGRDTFVEFFKGRFTPQEPADRIKQPVISIVAEGDIVIVTFIRPVPHPDKPGKTYAITWFDKFRIEDGRIAEHWDPAEVWLNGAPPGAEFFKE